MNQLEVMRRFWRFSFYMLYLAPFVLRGERCVVRGYAIVRLGNGEAKIEGQNNHDQCVSEDIHTFSIYSASPLILLDTKDELSISTPVRI